MMDNNRMAEVAKMFGLELGESFKITSDTHGDYQNYYRFTENNCLETSDDGVEWKMITAEVLLKRILMGNIRIIKLPWKPRDNEYYFIPEIRTPEMFSYLEWTNDYMDNHMYKHGLICRTKEEAIRKAELLMEYFKNNYIEGNENNG